MPLQLELQLQREMREMRRQPEVGEVERPCAGWTKASLLLFLSHAGYARGAYRDEAASQDGGHGAVRGRAEARWRRWAQKATERFQRAGNSKADDTAGH